MKHFKQALKYGTGLGLAVAAMASQAALDVTAVTSGLSDAATAVATVGVAALAVYIGIKAYKFIRRAM